MSDIPRSKYSTARFYFEILTVLCILQIVVAVVIFIAAFLSGQDSRWAIAPFVQLPRSTVMWLALFAAFLGLGEIAAIQVSQAVLDMADNSRMTLELTIKHQHVMIGGAAPQIAKLRSEPKLKRDAPPDTLEDRVPMPELGRQFAPLRASSHNPQDRFHEQTRIASGLAGISMLAKAEGLDDRPMGVGQGTSGQGCFPLFATLNQNSHQIGILNVNRP